MFIFAFMKNETKTIPIVLIHKGNSDYLPVSLWQLRQTQPPQTPIYLVGNADNAHFSDVVTHLNYTDYIADAQTFTDSYKHYSTNAYDYELFCIQRWFVLRALMRANKWQSCIYLDSDILTYTNLADAPQAVLEAGMTVSGISAHTNFVNSYETLSLFCDFITELYKNTANDTKLKHLYETHIAQLGAGGISDMTMFTLFRESYPNQVLDISQTIEGQTYDVTIDYHNGFEMHGQFKRIIWQNGLPFAKVSGKETLVLHNTLHFQGKSKARIKEFMTTANSAYKRFYAYAMGVFYWQKVKRKIFG